MRRILELDFGRCAIVSLDDAEIAAALAAMPDDERAIAQTLGLKRRGEHVAGRLAMRLLLPDAPAIGMTDRGAPQLPQGWSGSIAHKSAAKSAANSAAKSAANSAPNSAVNSAHDSAVNSAHGGHDGLIAAALVAPIDAGHVGIDLEVATARRIDISPRILTPREQAALPDRGPAVTLRFAIKEAIYKAVDPFVRRYVGFTEVELDVGDDGSCVVTVVDPERLPVAIEARWRELDGHWLATARALRTSRGP